MVNETQLFRRISEFSKTKTPVNLLTIGNQLGSITEFSNLTVGELNHLRLCSYWMGFSLPDVISILNNAKPFNDRKDWLIVIHGEFERDYHPFILFIRKITQIYKIKLELCFMIPYETKKKISEQTQLEQVLQKYGITYFFSESSSSSSGTPSSVD